MKTARRLLICINLILLIVLSACGRESMRVLVVGRSASSSSYEAMKQAASEWAGQRGAELTIAAPETESAGEQQKVLEEQLGRRWDIICVEPLGEAQLSPLLEYAKDSGSVVVCLGWQDMAVADYNLEPFSANEVGASMMDQLGGLTKNQGSYITVIPDAGDKAELEMEEAAVGRQKAQYAGLLAVSRLCESGGDGQKAADAVKSAFDKYAINGVLFFSAADGLGIAGLQEAGQIDAVGVGDYRTLRAAVEEGRIKALYYWDEENLVLTGLDVAYAEATDKGYESGEDISGKYEGYTLLRHTQSNTWVAGDINLATP